MRFDNLFGNCQSQSRRRRLKAVNADQPSLYLSKSNPSASSVTATEVRLFLSLSTSAILEIPAPITVLIIDDQHARFLAQQSINKRDSSFQPSFCVFSASETNYPYQSVSANGSIELPIETLLSLSFALTCNVCANGDKSVLFTRISIMLKQICGRSSSGAIGENSSCIPHTY